MIIACLHTAESNIGVFEAAAQEVGIPSDSLVHTVRPDLLAEAEEAGGLTECIVGATVRELVAIGQGADAVLLTCSTLGPTVAFAGRRLSVPVLGADAALAMQAARTNGHVLVLCAVGTTVEPTTALFESVVNGTRTSFEVRVVEGAWDIFKSGDRTRYLSTIAGAAEAAYAEGAAVVAFAQASMAGAAALVTGGPRPLTSPAAALGSILETLQSNAG